METIKLTGIKGSGWLIFAGLIILAAVVAILVLKAKCVFKECGGLTLDERGLTPEVDCAPCAQNAANTTNTPNETAINTGTENTGNTITPVQPTPLGFSLNFTPPPNSISQPFTIIDGTQKASIPKGFLQSPDLTCEDGLLQFFTSNPDFAYLRRFGSPSENLTETSSRSQGFLNFINGGFGGLYGSGFTIDYRRALELSVPNDFGTNCAFRWGLIDAPRYGDGNIMPQSTAIGQVQILWFLPKEQGRILLCVFGAAFQAFAAFTSRITSNETTLRPILEKALNYYLYECPPAQAWANSQPQILETNDLRKV